MSGISFSRDFTDVSDAIKTLPYSIIAQNTRESIDLDMGKRENGAYVRIHSIETQLSDILLPR